MTDSNMDTTSPADTASSAEATPASPPTPPGLVGRMTPEEMDHLAMLRQQAQPLMMKIGELEVQKQRIMEQLLALDQQGHEALDMISTRLGVEKSTKWFALADGSVFLSNAAGGPPSS